MIEHTMDVSSAELAAAAAACANLPTANVADLVSQGYFTSEAVAKSRGMNPTSAKNLCAHLFGKGEWERQLTRREGGRSFYMYRPLKKTKEAKKK